MPTTTGATTTTEDPTTTDTTPAATTPIPTTTTPTTSSPPTTTTPTTPSPATTTTTTTATTGGAPLALSGVYTNAADVSDTQAFATWRGSPVSLVSDYLSHTGDWSGLTSPNYWLDAWQPLTSKGVPLVLGVPMIPASGDTFQAGAAGAYDSYYKTLAQDLVTAGDSNAIIRLAWEFNGNWYPWSITASGADSAANFVADWQDTVDAMRSVAGQKFQFVWNVNNGPGSVATTAQMYPGNAYVDYIGVDAYDDGGWNQVLNETDGLAYYLRFAEQQDKPLAIPEWGIGTSGDDPTYIQDMYAWLKQNASAIGFEAFYDYNEVFVSQFPKSAAEYQSLYR